MHETNWDSIPSPLSTSIATVITLPKHEDTALVLAGRLTANISKHETFGETTHINGNTDPLNITSPYRLLITFLNYSDCAVFKAGVHQD